jgi:Subtilisin inhibitor-like
MATWLEEAEGVSVDQPGPGADEATDLTIVVVDGAGTRTTYQLVCGPPGGDHPRPELACRVLAANGAKALPPVHPDMACTQIYGGPETAFITGTWRGQPVQSRLSRHNGCEIARWNALAGLLPRGGM